MVFLIVGAALRRDPSLKLLGRHKPTPTVEYISQGSVSRFEPSIQAI